jgi:hypothetical protein
MSTLAASSDPVRAAAPGIVFLARLGYAAKGVVYLVIGVLAARLAAGAGGQATDQNGALRVIGDGPLGKLALGVIGVGLLGYMVWRLVSAATDAERRGDDPTSLAVRTGHAIRGIAYGLLGLEALRSISERGGAGGEGGERAESLTARLFEMPFGTALVYLAALGFVGYAGYQAYRAWSEKKVRSHLDLAEAGPARARWIVRIGQFGIAARAVVFALLGVFLVRAARERDSSEAGGLSDSLTTLAAAPYGRVALGVVALGLAAYGVYELATARYRHMRALG